jgi:hypothetical protein
VRKFLGFSTLSADDEARAAHVTFEMPLIGHYGLAFQCDPLLRRPL